MAGKPEHEGFSLRELLRRIIGHGKKPKLPFASEAEALEFLNRVYNETGGVTPELRRAYRFYKQNFHDDCPPRSAAEVRKLEHVIEANGQIDWVVFLIGQAPVLDHLDGRRKDITSQALGDVAALHREGERP